MNSLFENYEEREYQEKIFNICIERNSLIYLPTGSGKTLIAMKVINHFSSDLHKSLEEGGKRSVFLVNTCQLADQQSQNIAQVLRLKVGCWTSETKKKTWSKTKFLEEFGNNQVIVSTAQLFVDVIKHSIISIAHLNVVVFDECHHARKNHPYHEFMKQFKHVHPSQHPRVLGLSGMLVGLSSSITVDTVEEELKALESTFQSKILTVSKIQEYMNVMLYSTNPTESFMRYKPLEFCELSSDLNETIEKVRWNLYAMKIDGMTEKNPKTLNITKSRKLKEIALLFEDVKYNLETMGLFAAYLSLKAIRVQYCLIKKKPIQNRKFLETVKFCISTTDKMINVIDEEMNFKNPTREKIFEHSSPKVQNLIALLRIKFNSPERERDLQCLVFVTRCFTAKCLYHLLKTYAECDPTFNIISSFVVGVNSELPESIEDAITLNSNHMALEKFRNKTINCLVTSSVLEEGIDLQACNLVIMYDEPVTLRSYVQSKGRARVKNSDYIVLLNSNDAAKFLANRDKMNEIDKKLKSILIKSACDRILTQEDIEKEQMEVWDPFFSQKNALVNNVSSVALINRFVSRYGNVNLMWERKDVAHDKHIAILRFPEEVAVKINKRTMESDPFVDIKNAKQHAAFKACQLLYECGLLDHNLLPKC